VREAVYVQYLMGVNGVIVDMVEEISNAVADFRRQPVSQRSLGIGVSSMDGSKHQAFSQEKLGFLLRLMPELIDQPHWG
jgi:glycerophosphodiester phosphodiesterase